MMLDPQLQDVLERLRDERERLFGTRDVRLAVVRSADREASKVLKVSVTGGSDVRAIFVKVFKPREGGSSDRDSIRARVVQDFDVTSRLCESMASVPRYAVVRPLACFPDQLAVITAEADGETLSDLLDRRAAWWPSATAVEELGTVLADVGGWLRAFQAIEPRRERFSLDHMRAYIDVRLRRLLATQPPQLDARYRESLLGYFDRMALLVDTSDLREVLTHADLAPSNVLVNGRQVTVIDFDLVAPGGVFMDVARLYTQLEFLAAKPKFRLAIVRKLQRCLLEGFDPALGPERPLFRLFVLQHLLCHMSNLARHPGAALVRLYNRHQLRLHQRWLRTLAA
jgi:Phosphotransferase enzyme family